MYSQEAINLSLYRLEKANNDLADAKKRWNYRCTTLLQTAHITQSFMQRG